MCHGNWTCLENCTYLRVHLSFRVSREDALCNLQSSNILLTCQTSIEYTFHTSFCTFPWSSFDLAWKPLSLLVIERYFSFYSKCRRWLLGPPLVVRYTQTRIPCNSEFNRSVLRRAASYWRFWADASAKSFSMVSRKVELSSEKTDDSVKTRGPAHDWGLYFLKL